MFINKTEEGKNNTTGENIALLRKKLGFSQRALADKLQLMGLDVNKNAIQRMESGQRFITDIELIAFKNIFNIQLKRFYFTNGCNAYHWILKINVNILN